jgi:NADH-quinone oxidoreductase subunit E
VSATETAAAVDLTPALEVLDEMSPVTAGDVIPLLQKLQDRYGYLPREAVLEVARRTGLPASRFYGVATFYAQFHLRPRGRHTIRCCRGTACHVRGSKELLDAIKRELDVEEGGTTKDLRFTLESVACLGTCFLAPVIMVDNDYYGRLIPKKLKSILNKYS